MWNIRMRASQKAGGQIINKSAKEDSPHELHISGAEGIYKEKDISNILIFKFMITIKLNG